MAFLIFALSSRLAVACSSDRVLGGGEMRLLLVICVVEIVSRFRQGLTAELLV